MDAIWRPILWHQFGAAIDMLENALTACPDDLWAACLWTKRDEPAGFLEFWYAELLLDDMRHVQEHAAQLNLFLGQRAGMAARWVAQIFT